MPRLPLALVCLLLLTVTLQPAGPASAEVVETLPMDSQWAYAFTDWDDPVYDLDCTEPGVEQLSIYSWNGVKRHRVIYSLDMSQIPAGAAITDVMPRIWARRVAIDQPCELYGYVGVGSNDPDCSDCMTFVEAFHSGGCNIDGGDDRIFRDTSVSVGDYVDAPLYDQWAPGESNHEDVVAAAQQAHANADAGAHNHFLFIWFYLEKQTSDDTTARGELYGAGAPAPYWPNVEIHYELPPEVNSVAITGFTPPAVEPGQSVTCSGSVSGSGTAEVEYYWRGDTPDGAWEAGPFTTQMTDGSGAIPAYGGFPTTTPGHYDMHVEVTSPNVVASASAGYDVLEPLSVTGAAIDAPLPPDPGQGCAYCVSGSISGSGSGPVAYRWTVVLPGGDPWSSAELSTTMTDGTGAVPSFCELPTDLLGEHELTLEVLAPDALVSAPAPYEVLQVDLLSGAFTSDGVPEEVWPGEEFPLSFELTNPGTCDLTVGLTCQIRPLGGDTWYADPLEALHRTEAVVAAGETVTGERLFSVDLSAPWDAAYEMRFQIVRVANDAWHEVVDTWEDGGSLGLYVLDLDQLGAPEVVPLAHALHPAHPNPFNPQTTIVFDLPRPEPVRLEIYGLDGRRVARLVSSGLSAGRHRVTWDGRDDGGQRVASGTYLCRLVAGGYTASHALTLVK